ncbi:hypothetical protein ACOSP7_005970 [Xanthoceras sorbifolium]
MICSRGIFECDLHFYSAYDVLLLVNMGKENRKGGDALYLITLVTLCMSKLAAKHKFPMLTSNTSSSTKRFTSNNQVFSTAKFTPGHNLFVFAFDGCDFIFTE